MIQETRRNMSQDLKGCGDVLQGNVDLQRLTSSLGTNFFHRHTPLAMLGAPLAGNSSCPDDSPSDTRRRRNRRKHTKSVVDNTKMCQFHAKGCCNKAASCSFAHGEVPLQATPTLRRTRLCTSFAMRGTCKDGMPCNYAHSLEELCQESSQDGVETVGNATIVGPADRTAVSGFGQAQAKWHWPCPPASPPLAVHMAMSMDKCMQAVPTEYVTVPADQTFQAQPGRQVMKLASPTAASAHDMIGTFGLSVKKTFIHFDKPKWVRPWRRSSSADARFAYDH